MSRYFVWLGSILILLGILLKIPSVLVLFKKVGHLPGDIIIRKPGLTLYFPVTTSIIISILLTIIIAILWKK